MMQRWTFYDPYTAETYVFPMNGREGGDPAVKKNVATMPTCASDGRHIMYEGMRSPQEIPIKGRVRSQTDRNILKSWCDKPYQILWTNDLGEQRWIKVTDLTFTRLRVSSRQYKADYEMRALLVNIP